MPRAARDAGALAAWSDKKAFHMIAGSHGQRYETTRRVGKRGLLCPALNASASVSPATQPKGRRAFGELDLDPHRLSRMDAWHMDAVTAE